MGDNKLIETKLHTPLNHSGLIRRENLVNRLSKGMDRRFIFVSGPAGSGKTSLVCQWIHETSLNALWYSIDETDNEADLFFRYLLTTVSGLGDQVASVIRPLLYNQKRISTQTILSLLIECSKTIPKDVYLVLDDYHLIHKEEIHRVISHLLNRMPPRMHLVMISRYAPPFPTSQLKLRNQATEIVADDLKFTWQETRQYFTEILPVNLSKDELQTLNQYLEGWIGGMQLFGISLNAGEALGDLNDIRTRACLEATDFLVEQVLNGQPEPVRSFLQSTALLSRFNADLCREVTGQDDASEIMSFVNSNNLFTEPLDAQHTWYRYHPLLSEVIRKQMKLYSPEVFREIHRKAARWFAENGLLEDV